MRFIESIAEDIVGIYGPLLALSVLLLVAIPLMGIGFAVLEAGKGLVWCGSWLLRRYVGLRQWLENAMN